MSLKHDIEQKLGQPVKIKAGMPGSLDIYVDGQRIFSKAQAGRMPQNADILSAIQQRST